METDEFVAFVRQRGLAVVATLGPDDTPQATVVAVVATDLGEVLFGAERGSRKFVNIQRRPEVALAIGWDEDEIAVQCEGIADEPQGTARERCEQCYLERYPIEPRLADGQELGLVRVRPNWLRYADTRRGSYRWEETFPAAAEA
ncbi:MAG TPA: pyridoxamine 5'-phosphate oxidase family protein [Streptosporangiaceae bacterium]|nr:pyridoxamine 5'-phosphate oxidase family protein [Streptosporangiaceae bacterium]